jgi:hypothetical protein
MPGMFDPLAVWQYLCAYFDVDPHRCRDDRGVITTEFAVLVFIVVAGAIVVAGIVVAAAKNNASSVPTPAGS